MSLREEMWKYEQITGESAEHVPIIKLGAFLDGYDMGVKALEQTRWIPVSERLPEKVGVYLVSMNRLGYPKREVDGFVCGRWERFGSDVIAWCEIPEPYKESEDAE